MFELKQLRKAVSSHVGGGTPSRQVPSYWGGGIPWASVKDFSDDATTISTTEETISMAGLNASASNLIPAGTPLVCTRMAVGRAALPLVATSINQDVKALFPAEGVSPFYLLRLLNFIRPKAEAQAVGSTVKGIRIQAYLDISAPMAPAGEQPVIAYILNSLDTNIRQTEAIIAKLQQVKHGLLHDLLTRGIDANGELRPPVADAPHLYKESPLGWIPKVWRVLQLQKVADVVDPQPDHRTPREQEDGVPYLGIGDFDDNGEIDSNVCRKVVWQAFTKQLRRFEIQPGDIIFGKIGTIGQPKKLPSGRYALSANVLLIQPKETQNFVYYAIAAQGFMKQIQDITNTTSQPALGIETFRELLIQSPHPDEQLIISKRLDLLDSKLQTECFLLKKHKSQKTGLMDDLLTGRVRVTSLLKGSPPL